jgi:hypothetical protein
MPADEYAGTERRSGALRRLITLLGFAILATAMGLGVIDGARSISASGLEFSSLGAALSWLQPKLFSMLEPAVRRNFHPVIWDPLLLNVFLLPAVPVLFGLGGLLLVLGRSVAPSAIGRT